MSARRPAGERRREILEALAGELERAPGSPITTARLAHAVGLSEAALYRHFASKAQMFEGLIAFAEETLFERINRILEENVSARARCGTILWLVLAFAERNPGIARVLAGEALTGGQIRLRERVEQLHARLETQLKQVLREGSARGEGMRGDPNTMVQLLRDQMAGRVHAYVRSGFARSPLDGWEAQWRLVEQAFFI